MSQYTPVKLAYITCDPVGESDDTLSPIILLHGVTGSKEMWLNVPQIIANKTKRKVYVLDSRNHGDTEWTEEFNFEMNADDLLNFLDTISAPRVILVGHSMGGMTSIRAALRSPERVDMVFVEDMYVKKPSQEVLDLVARYATLVGEAVRSLPVDCPEKEVSHKIMNFIAEKMPEVSQNLFDNESMCKIKFPIKRDSEGRYLLKTNSDVIAKAMQNGETLLTEPKDGLYEGPSFFIYGAASPFKVNEDEEKILKFFPNAKLIPVENASHSIHVQFPDQFADIVVKHILKH